MDKILKEKIMFGILVKVIIFVLVKHNAVIKQITYLSKLVNNVYIVVQMLINSKRAVKKLM